MLQAFDLGLLSIHSCIISTLVGENHPPSLEFFGFDEELYLSLNEDVAAAVLNGHFYRLYTTTSRLGKGSLGMVLVLEG